MRIMRSSSAVADMQDVAILHDVIFALKSQLAFGSGVGLRARLQQRVPVNSLGPDEVLFQIRMDGSRRSLRARSPGHGPGAALIFTNGEERNHTQQLISLADQPGQPTFLQSVTEIGRAHV